ncbi:hypothetical protein [Streptomyces sp. NPDC057413]|uniref:hypothetical protein n=1 Tax=Streptomyces sp. NPDC057413 TaxID=3346124 RepID=UPI00367D0E6C
MSTEPRITIDGQPVPLDDCIWLERRPCGCVVSAAVAVVDGYGGRAIETPEQAHLHFNPTELDRSRAARAGLAAEPITSQRYQDDFRDSWACAEHIRP